jgi:hypothetical protein
VKKEASSAISRHFRATMRYAIRYVPTTTYHHHHHHDIDTDEAASFKTTNETFQTDANNLHWHCCGSDAVNNGDS